MHDLHAPAIVVFCGIVTTPLLSFIALGDICFPLNLGFLPLQGGLLRSVTSTRFNGWEEDDPQ